MLELLERQERLTVNQWKIISAAILGDMLDFFDFFLIGAHSSSQQAGSCAEDIALQRSLHHRETVEGFERAIIPFSIRIDRAERRWRELDSNPRSPALTRIFRNAGTDPTRRRGAETFARNR